MKKLTVMVSLYNSGEWIENRLNNLRQSTLRDMEIWCVNANSPDPRDDTIPQKYPVRYIKFNERIGVYAAWNHIIKNSNSVYITNANSDDLIAPNAYERLVGYLDRHSQTGFAYPSWYTTSTPNLTWHDVLNSGAATAKDGQPGFFKGDIGKAGVGHFPVWRRALHTSLGYFDEGFKALADVDWWTRCYYIANCKFKWMTEFLACYLWRNGQNLWNQEVNETEWHKYHTKVAAYRQGKLE